MSNDMDMFAVILPRHTMRDLLMLCSLEATRQGFTPAYVQVIRDAVRHALNPPVEPTCGMPDALVHHNSRREVCMWCWAEPEDMSGRECQHHTPCLVCASQDHSECQHAVSMSQTDGPLVDVLWYN